MRRAAGGGCAHPPAWPRVPAAVLLALALALAGCGGEGGAAARTDGPAPVEQAGRVRDVLGGDTVLVVADDGSRLRVRVIGIDAPALGGDGRPAACGAVAARAAVVSLALGRRVRLVLGAEPEDGQGRTLARVDLLEGPASGTDLASALVERGLVRAVRRPPNGAQAATLDRLERRARAAGAGLWGRCGAARAFPEG